jgi:hypothetical protein
MLRFPFLLISVFRFVSPWHLYLLGLRGKMLHDKPLTAPKVPRFRRNCEEPGGTIPDADQRLGYRGRDFRLPP